MNICCKATKSVLKLELLEITSVNTRLSRSRKTSFATAVTMTGHGPRTVSTMLVAFAVKFLTACLSVPDIFCGAKWFAANQRTTNTLAATKLIGMIMSSAASHQTSMTIDKPMITPKIIAKIVPVTIPIGFSMPRRLIQRLKKLKTMLAVFLPWVQEG